MQSRCLHIKGKLVLSGKPSASFQQYTAAELLCVLLILVRGALYANTDGSTGVAVLVALADSVILQSFVQFKG